MTHGPGFRLGIYVFKDAEIVDTSGMEMGFHLLERAGYGERFIREVARIMEYAAAYELYRADRELAAPPSAA